MYGKQQVGKPAYAFDGGEDEDFMDEYGSNYYDEEDDPSMDSALLR